MWPQNIHLTTDGRTAASGGKDGLRVWDLATGQCLHTLGDPLCFGDSMITPDGCTAILGWYFDGTLRVWDLATGRCLRSFEGHSASFWGVRLTPNGRTAISGSSEDGTLRVWDLATGRCLCTLEGHTAWVEVLGLTPDGRIVVSMNGDHTLRVWDLAIGQCIAMFPGADLSSVASKVTIDGRLVLGKSGGQVEFVTLQGFHFGPPIITAVRSWFVNLVTSLCEHCGRRFEPESRVLDAIRSITAHLTPDQSPCLALPPEAWDESHLLSACPHCHEPVKFNPFVTDKGDTHECIDALEEQQDVESLRECLEEQRETGPPRGLLAWVQRLFKRKGRA